MRSSPPVSWSPPESTPVVATLWQCSSRADERSHPACHRPYRSVHPRGHRRSRGHPGALPRWRGHRLLRDAELDGPVDEVVGDAAAGEGDDALRQQVEQFVVAPERCGPSVGVPVRLAHVRRSGADLSDRFTLDARPFRRCVASWPCTLFAPLVAGFHLAVVIVVVGALAFFSLRAPHGA